MGANYTLAVLKGLNHARKKKHQEGVKYSPNFAELIKHDGFEFSYRQQTEELNYEVYRKGLIEITICHNEKIITTSVSADVQDLGEMSLSYADVKHLDRILNAKR